MNLRILIKPLILLLSIVILFSSLTIGANAYAILNNCQNGVKKALTFYSINVSESYISNTFATSMSVWNSAGYGQLLKYGGNKNSTPNSAYDGINKFYKVNTGDCHVYAITTTHSLNGDILEADISLNSYYDYYSILSDGLDLQSILTHELGHAIGLDHSNISNATMYSIYQANSTHMRDLHSDDLSGLEAIYG